MGNAQRSRFGRSALALPAACVAFFVPVATYGIARLPAPTTQEVQAGVTVDSIGERILVTFTPLIDRTDDERWQLVQELRLGTVAGDGAEGFADIHDLAVDGIGRIYVLDVGLKGVRVFDADGEFLKSMATEGDGPGEWRYARRSNQSIVWQEPNRLWISDGQQLMSVDTLGNELSRFASGQRFFRPGDLPTATKVVSADTTGAVIARLDVIAISGFGQGAVPQHTHVARLPVSPAHETLPGDTLTIETRTITMGGGSPESSAGGRLTVRRPQATSASKFAWAPQADGTLWLAQRSRHRFDKLSFKGDTIRTVQRADLPPVTPDGVDFTPVISGLDVSPEGWLWVRWQEAETVGSTTWDILDNCGRHRGTVTAPVALRALDIRADGRVYGVASDALDIDYVYRFRLEGEVGAPVAAEHCPF